MKALVATCILLLACFNTGILAQDVSNQTRAYILGERMIDAGEFKEASEYLNRATETHPDNDQLLALYGISLYESHRIKDAEKVFRKALIINPLNKVARGYVEDIRTTTDASISEEYQHFKEVLYDKIGDGVVMFVAFLVATSMGSVFKYFSSRRFARRSRHLFVMGEYEDFSDLLEIQLATNELSLLRDSVNFMLAHKTPDEAIDILEHYVNTEDKRNTLKRMITLSAKDATQS